MLQIAYSLYAVSAGSSWLLSFLFFYNITRVNTIANRWLAAFYLFLAFALFQQFLYKMGLDKHAVILISSLEITKWALAPCFYIAILYFVRPGRKSFQLLGHFIPALFFLLFSCFFLNSSFSSRVGSSTLPLWLGFIVRYFSMLQMLIYWILSFLLITSHSKNIQLVSSTTEKIDLLWVKQLLWGTLILIVTRMLIYQNGSISFVYPVLYCGGIFFIAIHSLRQEIIYPVIASVSAEIEAVLDKNRNTERLSSDQVSVLKSNVLAILEERKLFLDPALTLPALSLEVGIGINELSYVINNGFQKNFYNLINEMRVEEAKKILLSEKSRHLDKVGIAIQAGFNSKTTFNTTFKKLTGQTPTEFIRFTQATQQQSK